MFSLCSLNNGGFASGHLYGSIRIWRESNLNEASSELSIPYTICQILNQGRSYFVMTICQLPNGLIVSSNNCVGERRLNVWSMQSGSLQRTIEVHSGPVMSVCCLDGCNRVASVGQDRLLLIMFRSY